MNMMSNGIVGSLSHTSALLYLVIYLYMSNELL